MLSGPAAEVAEAQLGAVLRDGPAVLRSNAFLVVAAIALRGLSTGFIPNVRVVWLKALPDQEVGRRILIITKVIIQSSYGLIGVLLLLGIAQPLALTLVLIDAATSAFAIPLFLSMRDFGVTSVEPSGDGMAFGFLLTRENLPILTADLSLAVAMGGTNIFLVRAGDGLFHSAGGYGLSLVVYAAAFLLGGFLVQAHGGLGGRLLGRSQPLAPWALMACLAVLSCAGLSPALHATAFFVLFLTYPIFLLTLDTIWFRVTSHTNIGPTFATRQMLISLILAVGEILYPRWTLSSELIVRLVTATAAAFTYFLLVHERRNDDVELEPSNGRIKL